MHIIVILPIALVFVRYLNNIQIVKRIQVSLKHMKISSCVLIEIERKDNISAIIFRSQAKLYSKSNFCYRLGNQLDSLHTPCRIALQIKILTVFIDDQHILFIWWSLPKKDPTNLKVFMKLHACARNELTANGRCYCYCVVFAFYMCLT